jgi:predicted metal-dependent phosphoesterase TrpH
MFKQSLLIASILSLSTLQSFAADKWYKGNTHVHTTLSGHADTTPDEVAKWYLDREYNFLILSEHNKFIDPASVALPEGRREDFILIPGEEVTDDNHVVHTTAMNIEDLVAEIVPTAKPCQSFL